MGLDRGGAEEQSRGASSAVGELGLWGVGFTGSGVQLDCRFFWSV